SGIPDFRSADGLFFQDLGTTYAPEEIVSHSFFVHHPREFWKYHSTHLLYPEAQPNKAHLGLAELERRGKVTAVITQNIDGLHQKAGSRNVLELHGTVWRNYCVDCGQRFDMAYVLASEDMPECSTCGGIVRPDVVLYEEGLDPQVMDESIEQLSAADTLIVGGTSLAVYPAAGLIRAFRGRNLVLINKEPTPADRLASLVIHAPIGETLGGVVLGH
ncbi:MAG: NAD-dependent protein deacylase, partial [Propionibacteriaceae bacterium]|nr:NAD-dependent protein deacylase [Propionibacteriaceae bacterium]